MRILMRSAKSFCGICFSANTVGFHIAKRSSIPTNNRSRGVSDKSVDFWDAFSAHNAAVYVFSCNVILYEQTGHFVVGIINVIGPLYGEAR